eukprot:scaffold94183_cov43-Attheya_sp.AAC.1
MAVSTSIALATGSFLDRQQGRTLPISIRIVWVAEILAQRLGMSSGSEGGMLAAVDLISAAVELDDIVESVELLVALGGGQSAKVFTSFGYGWAHLMRLVVDIMHLNWQQSTQIGAQRIEFTPLLCLGCRERLDTEMI